ncbi:MAG TPA: RDD family protein [Candidatus Paceibacterota bacterium]
MHTHTTFQAATASKRLVNYLIDNVFIVVILLALFRIIPFYREGTQFVVTLLVYFGYYFLFEYFCEKTLGKFITKTRVVTYENKKPSIDHFLLRTLVRFVPFEAFSFIAKRPVGFHDVWASTRVVSDQEISNQKLPE